MITINKPYLEKAKHTSAVFRDNVVHPLDEAVFWIEHVAQFKGTKHLKSHAINMSWFTYLSLDVILANLLRVFIVYVALRRLVNILFRKNPTAKDLKKKLK